jgi:hypothetical protein
MALLVCVAACALTAAAAPKVLTLDISKSEGPSGITVKLTPYVSGPTCALYVGTTMVKTDFPCGGYSDELHYRSTNYNFTEEPGHYDVGICSLPCKLTDETVARTTFDVLAVVPDLTDLTRAQAQDSLTKATLTLGGTLSPRGAQPDWQVIGQRPKAGSMLKARSTVSITLGPPKPTPTTATPTTTTPTTTTPTIPTTTTAPTPTTAPTAVPIPPTVSVPDVRQYALEEAQQILAGVGLTARTSSSTGTVVDQNPSPGAQVARGAPIVLTVQHVDPKPDPPYAAASAALLFLVGLVVGAVQVVRRRARRRPDRTSSSPPPVDVRFVPPTYVSADAVATAANAGLDVRVRLTDKVSTTSESRTS